MADVLYPPSLSAEVPARAFRSASGEIGIVLADIESFLAACAADNVAVLEWEVWLADHGSHPDRGPVPAPGNWCGLIPERGTSVPSVFTYSIDDRWDRESWQDFVTRSAAEALTQIETLELEQIIAAAWHRYLRINFFLADEEGI